METKRLKRNSELVRQILLQASDPDRLFFEDDEPAAEHAAYLIDQDYVDGTYVRDAEGTLSFIEVRGLTPTGTALTEAIADEPVWKLTKKLLAASLDRISLEGVRAMAEVVGKHMEV